jgi:hypothetical protein
MELKVKKNGELVFLNFMLFIIIVCWIIGALFLAAGIIDYFNYPEIHYAATFGHAIGIPESGIPWLSSSILLVGDGWRITEVPVGTPMFSLGWILIACFVIGVGLTTWVALARKKAVANEEGEEDSDEEEETAEEETEAVPATEEKKAKKAKGAFLMKLFKRKKKAEVKVEDGKAVVDTENVHAEVSKEDAAKAAEAIRKNLR